MKYITAQEFHKLEFRKTGRDVLYSKWYLIFKKIPVGEALIIDKAEWDRGTKLKEYVGGLRRRKEDPLHLRFNTLNDGTGWVIRRIK